MEEVSYAMIRILSQLLNPTSPPPRRPMKNSNALLEDLLEMDDSMPSFAFDRHGNRVADSSHANEPSLSWPGDFPEDVLEDIDGQLVLEAGFGAGPGCVAGKIEKYEPPVSIEDGLGWLSSYATIFKAAHLRLEDGSLLWLWPSGCMRWAHGKQSPPRPGLEVGGLDVHSEHR